VAAAVVAWRRERARCYLLDFACYKPPDEFKVDLGGFLRGSRDFGVRARSRAAPAPLQPRAGGSGTGRLGCLITDKQCTSASGLSAIGSGAANRGRVLALGC
jgi:hypothetical protein